MFTLSLKVYKLKNHDVWLDNPSKMIIYELESDLTMSNPNHYNGGCGGRKRLP
jgi:hypothetical protein